MPNKSVPQLDAIAPPIQTTDLLHAVRAGKDFQGAADLLITYQKIVTQISSAQFLAAATTPIVILAAQGTNTFINPVLSVLRNVAGGGAYVSPDPAGIWHASGTSALHEFSLTVATSITEHVEQGERFGKVKFVENDDLVFKVDGVDPTIGTNEFELTTWYTVLDFS